ncbi:unnamed protein product [Rotaria sordida]|uniref:Exportin-4 n=1 Tax=Rotaria sordida TaxID=392033 RepID=A0A818WAC7_9BILA|nr:unnamed protein product [Rotaria sordida]CAF3709602.1 unnamed protein product [Rotaria sordida]CAF3721773.1 unnamed protein product [Rotaria sordida]
MDMENIRQVLEDAAQIFLSAAHTITNERRREAEKVFLQFRRSQFSLDLYRYLIEHSSSSYVVYQTLTALREGIVKEWSSLNDALKEQVVQYLLSYVYAHYSTLSVHVREQALQILVVINKRRKAQRAQMAKNGFTVSLALTNLLQSTNNQEFEFGLTLLNAFINEYSFSNANEAGLTVEQRHSVKRDFEENELKTVLELLLNKIQSNLSSISSSSDLQLFSSILTIIEKILLWNFSSSFSNTRRTMESSNNVETIDWRPPISWKQLVFDQQLVEFFFHIYATLKSMNETKILLQRRCQILRCLSQLACLNGPLISDEPCRLRYLTTFSYYFVQTFLINSTLTINLIECFDISNIISNLITLFTVKGFCSMDNDLCNSFLQLMSQITILLCRTTIISSNNQLDKIIEDPTIAKETFDRLLQAWSRLLYGIDFGRFANLRSFAIEIFDTYLQTHLHINDNYETNDFDLADNDEDDKDLFSEQLICIGLFGRHIIDYALPLLIRLLVDRTKKLYNMMNNSSSNINTKSLDAINDDLHWLLLICGHVLTEEYDSDEQKTIPEAVMNFSREQVKYCDLNKCVQIAQHILQQSQLDLSDEIMHGVSPVTQCLVAVLKLSETERHLCNKGQFEYISVQVAVSLTWFIRRLAANYLGFDEQSYKDVSQILLILLGKGSEMLEFLTNYFLSKVITNLQMWASESDVIRETADLFVTLSMKKDSSLIIIKNDLFWTLANNVITNQMPIQLINEEYKRLLIKGITCTCLNNSSDEYRLHFDRSIFQILNQRLHSIVESIHTLIEQIKLNTNNKIHCTNALQTFYSENVLSQISTLINSYCGLIEGGSRCSSEQITYLFEHSQQTLQDILDLFDFYHNYCDQVQIILELFSLYAEHVLIYLNQNHTNIFYKYILRLLQIFTKCNYGKKTKEINADEDFNSHIYTLLNCLNHLLAKDFIDFSNENSTNTDVNVGDVVLYGLIICLPLIQLDNLLKIPSISICYYKLASSLCEQHSDCIFRLLNPDQYSIFLSTIKLGLDNYDNEICKMCLETIQNLTLYTIKQQKLNQTNEKIKYLEHFLDYLLQEIVITTTTLSDLFDTLAGTIYTLICAYPNQFYHILGQMKQYDENLSIIIDKLANDTGQKPDYNRKAKISFTVKFESFVTNLRRIMKK